MVMVWIVVCDGWMMVLWRMVLGCSGVWWCVDGGCRWMVVVGGLWRGLAGCGV